MKMFRVEGSISGNGIQTFSSMTCSLTGLPSCICGDMPQCIYSKIVLYILLFWSLFLLLVWYFVRNTYGLNQLASFLQKQRGACLPDRTSSLSVQLFNLDTPLQPSAIQYPPWCSQRPCIMALIFTQIYRNILSAEHF